MMLKRYLILLLVTLITTASSCTNKLELPEYSISQNDLNTKQCYNQHLNCTYNNDILYYSLGENLAAYNLKNNQKINTEIKTSPQFYIWGDYIIQKPDIVIDYMFELVKTKDFSVTPFVKKDIFEQNKNIDIKKFQPYNQYIFILVRIHEYKKVQDGEDIYDPQFKLFCYDIRTGKKIYFESEEKITQFWVHDNMLFYSYTPEQHGADYSGLYMTPLPEGFVNNEELEEDDVIKLSNPDIILTDNTKFFSLYFNDDNVVFADMQNIKVINYKEKKMKYINASNVYIVNVLDDWIYYSKDKCISRIKIDGTNDETFLELDDYYSSLIYKIAENEYVITTYIGSTKKLYHLKPDKELIQLK